MSGTGGSLIRRTVALVAAVAGLALIAAPVALADGDTITPQATVPFSGVVDASPTCHASTAMIDWGDGTTPSAGSISGTSPFSVSGSHTYAAANSYGGSITLSGGNCSVGSEDFFTADVSKAPPMFTQCPPVDANNGCQFLITVGNGSDGHAGS